MKLNEITKKMNELATLNAGKIDAKIKFEFSDGYVFIDDTTSPPTISNENNDADCVIEINNENFSKILNKKMIKHFLIRMICYRLNIKHFAFLRPCVKN